MSSIVALLASLGKLTDRLIELAKYREEKSRRIFDNLIEPIFNDLLFIHKDYLDMFEEVRNMLPGKEDGEKKTHLKLSRAYDYLEKQRRAFEPLREKLRAIARALPGDPDKDNKKDAFIRSVADYLTCFRKSTSMSSVSSILAQEIRAAAIRYSHARSQWESDEVRREVSASLRSRDPLNTEELDAYISKTLDDLRQKFGRTSAAYAEILVKVRNE